MQPCSSFNDTLNIFWSYKEHFAKFFRSVALSIQITDIYYLTFCKFASWIIESFKIVHGSVFMSIKMITNRGIPSEITNGAVNLYAIIVASLHPWRAWPSKNQKNKPMNCAGMLLAFYRQVNCRITFLIKGVAQYPLRIAIQNTLNSRPLALNANSFPVRPHPSLITHFISREPRNPFPNFGGIAKMVISHGVALLNRVASGLEPPQGYSLVAACFFIS